MLHDVVARNEVDHLRSHGGGQRFDQLVFAVGIARIADQPGEADAARVGVFDDALGDVVGGVHGHHFAGADDVDFLRLVLADRHREAAADDVAEHVVENEVEVVAVGALFFEEVDGGDHAATGAADPGLRATRFDALDPAVTDRKHVFELEIFDAASLGSELHDRVLRLGVQDQPRRVGLRVAADDHHLLTGLGERGDQILGGGGLADSSLAVNRRLT